MRRFLPVVNRALSAAIRVQLVGAVALGVAAGVCWLPAAQTRAADTTPSASKPDAARGEQTAPKKPTESDADLAADKRLRESEQFLASPKLEGRGLGTNGINLAADYLAGKYRELGLKTDLYDGQPFQKFTLSIGSKLGPAERNSAEFVAPPANATSDSKVHALRIGVDYNPLFVGGSGKFDLPLVFVGYGITAKGEKYDDYAGIDAKDKAVIVLRHQPQRTNPHGLFGTHDSPYAAISRKVSNAYEHGAGAVIFCTDDEEIHRTMKQAKDYLQSAVDELAKADSEFKKIEKPSAEQLADHKKTVGKLNDEIKNREKRVAELQDPVMDSDRGGEEAEGRTIPVLHVRRSALDPVVKAALGVDLATLEHWIDEGPKPQSAAITGWKIVGQTDILRTKTDVKNVLAELPGSGPHADETLVIGAHYDHLGYGGMGSNAPGVHAIHPGADDNGSGTSAILEVARRLVERSKEHPFPRRILFISFTGEERGLLGSARYVRDPLIPLDKTIAMLNMDMVGRMKDHKLIVYGTDTAKEFPELLKTAAAPYGFNIVSQPGGFGPSDHASFYAKHMPVLHFFTGTHSDYHRPTDTAEKLNVPDMRRVADLVADMAVALVEAPDRPHFTESKVSIVTISAQGDRPYFGSIPDFGREEPGYAISGVAAKSPAAEGGLKSGDIIVKLGESKVGNLEDFDSALRKHKPGEKVAVVVKRGKDEVKLEVTLAPPRG